MRIAIDTTPLLGARTGVGAFVRGALGALLGRADAKVAGYALTGQAGISGVLPTGVDTGRRVPARAALGLWERGAPFPTAEWLGRGRVDAVHGTNFVVPPTRRAGRVVTVHDLTAVRFPETCEPTSLRYPALVRRAVAEGAWVHTHAETIAEEVREWLGTHERVRAVAPGVDEPAAGHHEADSAGAGRRDAGPPGAGPPVVLALGTLEPRKDLPSLVSAFDSLACSHPEARLVIAGGRGWGADAVERAVAAARHRGRITLTGRVDDATRRRLLAEATVLAFPSRYEGFGLPVLEAMADGLPVVATAAGAVPEVAGDAAVIVPVGDADALAAALANVLEDGSLRATLAARGRRRAAEFTWARCGEGLLGLYRAAACA